MNKFFFFALATFIFFAAPPAIGQYSNLEFVQNKGQWNKEVKFKGDLNTGAFFLTSKGFSVIQHNVQDLQAMDDYYHGIPPDRINLPKSATLVTNNKTLSVRSHAYNVNFLNAGSPVVEPDKALNSYNNYFIGKDSSKWASKCSIYQAVTYKEMYKGVDVRYYTSDGQLKYDIILHPGANLSSVSLQFDGVDGLSVKDDELIIKTSVGEFKELSPYSYQVIDGQKTQVPCKFKVSGNTVSFIAQNYSPSATLIIDPTLIFSTFTGSAADNWGYTATYGPDGSFYAGGIVFGTGFKTSPGAYETDYMGGKSDEENIGGYDIGIMKFTPDGVNRSYATYLGGNGNEQPHSLVVDPQGELVIAGRTNSTDYPVKGFSKKGNGYDIVITKLNATGTGIIGSIQIGGANADGVNIKPKYPLPGPGPKSIRRNYGDDARSEVILDGQGDILLASNTQSSDFPVLGNVFQRQFGGNQDGVIIKLTPDLSNILFSTFLGGQNEDACFVLAINPANGNIYVGGNTVSNDLPGDKSGTLFPSFQGGESDGFISIITSDGSSLIKTTYAGTGGNDMVYGIQFDKYGFPYIMGTTNGSWPVQNAAFSQKGGKQFIAKLKPDLSAFEYSTVFGTNSNAPNLSPIAFLVDRCENVYVSGWGGDVNSRGGYPTSGTSGLTTTADAIQVRTDGSDFYFFVLERNAGRQLYGSFFGQIRGFGEHVDGGTSRFDRNGVIYQALCANCGRDVPFPTTPGVWAPTNGTSQCNLAAVKIAFNLAGIAGSIKSSIVGSTQDTIGCVPLTVTFRDTIAAGKRYTWNFGDGTPEIISTDPSIQHTYTAIGEYRVLHVAIDSGKCNVADTVFTNIKVRTFQAVLDFKSQKYGQCDKFDFKFTNNSTVSPAARSYQSNSFTWTFGDNTPPVVAGVDTVISHSFPGPGNYNVVLLMDDTTFCNAPVSKQKTLRIATNVNATFETPAKGCAPYNALFNNTSEGGEQFFWNFGDNTTSIEVSPTHLYTVPGSYTVKLVAIDSSTCNIIDSASFPIVVSTKPLASFGIAPDPPQENTPVIFTNTSIGGKKYVWNYGDGDTLVTISTQTVQHTYNETNKFIASLVATNQFGCSDTARQQVQAKVNPLLDVPNAFTPNGDGINDKVFVRGFGISKMLWRIYNRWGALVFETIDRTQGWDGYYKGGLQPPDVYHYVLSVQFFNNTTYQKKGDITLLK